MNKIGLVLVSFFFGLMGCSSNAQNTVKRYEVKSGIIKYRTSNSGKVMGSTIDGKGTESLYFKDWGVVELKESESTETTITKIFGQRNEETTSNHTMNKLENGKSYSVDFNEKVIYANRDMAMDLIGALNPNGNASEVGKSMLEGMGGEKVGSEKVLGYDCEVWTVAGGKQWIHKGVVLKVEMNLMGITTTTVALSAEFNVSVSDKYFKLPDFPMQKMESLGDSQEMFGDMGDMDDMEDFSDEMEKMRKMSYADWKKLVVSNDKEAAQMSEQELKTTYDMMQKMLKLKDGK